MVVTDDGKTEAKMTFAEFERLFFLKLDRLLEKLKREQETEHRGTEA